MNRGRRAFITGVAAASGVAALPTRGTAANPRRVALALGSGSHHGHALIGVLRELEREGFRPDLVVGTSVGAIVGALWASGLDSAAIARASERFTMWRNARFTWPNRGLFSNRGLQESVRELVRGRPMESWPMRFAAVATDLTNGGRVVIDRGDAAVAVAASAAMPVLCRPVPWKGRTLVDGALVEPVPARAARDLGADRVIGVDIAYRPADAPVEGVAATGFQAMHILVNALAHEQAEASDVRMHLSLHALMEGRDDYRDVLAQAGAQAVRASWPRIRELRA